MSRTTKAQRSTRMRRSQRSGAGPFNLTAAPGRFGCPRALQAVCGRFQPGGAVCAIIARKVELIPAGTDAERADAFDMIRHMIASESNIQLFLEHSAGRPHGNPVI
jgi:hypothetical protein